MAIGNVKRQALIYGLSDFFLFSLNYVLFIPLMTKYLSPSEYGVVVSLTTMGIFLVSVIQFGLPSATLRHYFTLEPKQRKDFLGTILFTAIGIALLAGVLLKLLASNVFYGYAILQPYINYVDYIVCGAILQIVLIYKTILLRAQGRIYLFMLVECSQFICMVALVLYSVVVMKEGVMGQVKGVFFTYVIFSVISLVILNRCVNVTIKYKHISKIGSFAFFVTLGYLVTFFQSRSNLLLTQKYLTSDEIGLLAVGLQFGSIFQFASASFEKAWQPYLYSQEREASKGVLINLINILLPIYALMALIYILFSQEFMRVLLTGYYDDAWILVIIYSTSAFFMALSSVFNSGLYYDNKARLTTVISALGAVANIILCLILTQRIGVIGAAISSLLSSVIVFIFVTSALKKTFLQNLPLANVILTLGLFFSFLVLGVYVKNNYFPENVWEGAGAKSAVLLTFMLLLRLFGLIDIKNLWRTIRK